MVRPAPVAAVARAPSLSRLYGPHLVGRRLRQRGDRARTCSTLTGSSRSAFASSLPAGGKVRPQAAATRAPRGNCDAAAHWTLPTRAAFSATVVGVLKGFDPLMNLVLDECLEYLRGTRGRASGYSRVAPKHQRTPAPHLASQTRQIRCAPRTKRERWASSCAAGRRSLS